MSNTKPIRFLTILVFLVATGVAGPPLLAQAQNKPLPEIRLDVAHVDVIPAYVAPGRKPYVDHLNAQPPVEALRLWGTVKIKPTGSSGRAVVIIRQASIVRVEVPAKTGVQNWFRRQPLERLEAAFDIELVIRDGEGRQRAKTVATVRHSKVVMDDAKPKHRRELRKQLTREAIRAVTQELAAQVRKALPDYAR